MPPRIIADSDDDDDGDNHSVASSAHSPRQNPPFETTRSSGRMSDVTGSTDPAFFQTIFNEQNNALSQRPTANWDASSPASNDVSSVQHARRVGKTRALVGAGVSSLTSVTDPTNLKSQKTSSGRITGELTQVTTPGRFDRPREARDPYELQSSPPDESPDPRRKRRKTDHHVVEAAPTLTLDSESSFAVAPRSLSTWQASRREDVEPALEPSNKPSMRLTDLVGSQRHRSSGTATNMNTQPTAAHSSPLGLQQYEQFDEATRATTRSPEQPDVYPGPRSRDSSPDIISAVVENHGARKAQKTTRSRAQKKGLRRSLDEDRDDDDKAPSDGCSEGPVEDYYMSSEDSNLTEQRSVELAKTKKPRGRPKKQPAQETTKAATASKTKDGKPALGVKKKRGRPRKSKPELLPEEPTAEEDTPAAELQDSRQCIETEGAEDYVSGEDEITGSPNEHSAGAGAAATSGGDEPSVAAQGPDPDAEEARDEEEASNPAVEDAAKANQEMPPRKDSESVTERKRQTGTQRGSLLGSGSISKPLYRIGLSKRSRIAPLLKTVPR